MILKGSQRGGANKLAAHLLNEVENDHVHTHDVRGFISADVKGALMESYAISRGTSCKQFLFSVSMNPPQDVDAPIELIEHAAQRIEEKLNLSAQSRVIMLHEKNGRRHAHAVWSRIDAETMKAVNLPFFKNKLMEVSRELYIEQGWQLPDGLKDRQNRSPLNFTRDEWQQAKRLGDDPKQITLALKECWQGSSERKSFIEALEKKGFYLARGDRRGFVAVDWRGEVYSLSRKLGAKSKKLKARLGDEAELPSVDETKAAIDQVLAKRMQDLLAAMKDGYGRKLKPLVDQKNALKARQKIERRKLANKQQEKHREEQERQQARYKSGFVRLLGWFTGRNRKIRALNEQEAMKSKKHDLAERDQLVFKQLKERGFLQSGLNAVREAYEEEKSVFRDAVFSKATPEQIEKLESIFMQHSNGPEMDLEPQL